MRRGIEEPLTLNQLARELDRQCEYLGWLFRQETGRTFHDRMTTLRLRRARRLLRDGEKVEAIVLLVGYRSKKNFYAQFRRRFALTPGEYRERVRRGEPLPDGRRTGGPNVADRLDGPAHLIGDAPTVHLPSESEDREWQV